MPLGRFRNLEDVDRALAAPRFVLLKHSTRCPVSARAFDEIAALQRAHPGVPAAWIDVLQERPWSDHVARATGVAHASPQVLLIREGRVAWHASHDEVTRKAVETALGMPSGLGGG